MPRELIAVAPRTPALREYDEPELDATQVRILTEFASPKHGTELVGYRDEPAVVRPYDPSWGAAMARPEDAPPRFPMRLGNMAVGVVKEVGANVTRHRVGDRVFGHWSIRETHTADESRVDPLPATVSAEAAVCLDPAVMALAARDAEIKLGDRVAVFGLGAIGLMAVQLSRLAGADHVVAADPLPARRALAVALGADVAIDPMADGGDAGLAIRRLSLRGDSPEPARERRPILGGYWDEPTQTSDLGVDVAVETSGSISALHHAIRATRFGGTVCVISYYGGEARNLYLGDEFHMNRLRLVSARAQSLPLRDHPGWTYARLVETALRWIAAGRLRTDGIINPVVAFDQSVDAYRAIDEHPERSIKLGVRFP